MDDLDCVMQLIKSDPEDDLHRLVYADILEERAELARATFIRSQLRSAVLEKARGAGRPVGGSVEAQLAIEQTEMLQWKCREVRVQNVVLAGHWCNLPALPQGLWWRRGFVEKIVCVENVFLEIGKQVLANNPVENIRLVDRRPAQEARGWYWLPNSVVANVPFAVAVSLYELMPAPEDEQIIRLYESAHEAHRALEVACLIYGRTT